MQGATQTYSKGFTLVELSIVLVILGLLVGGVLTGQALIRAAELRAVATEKDKYITAFYTFKDKYLALPGDMTNANAYWPDCGDSTTSATTGCNGDGNGFIDVDSKGEYVKVWLHLSRAGLVDGSYTGRGVMEWGYPRVSASNMPASKFPNSFWLMSASPCEGCTSYGPSPMSDNTHLMISLGSLLGNGWTPDPHWIAAPSSLTNAEALNIDTKVDDGTSFLGKMRGNNANGWCNDEDSSNNPDVYQLKGYANVTAQCVPSFLLQ